jgi:hypothetical protein
MVRGEDVTPPDTSRAWIRSPKYDASITGDVSNTKLKQQFSGIVTPRKGIRFTSSLSDEENRYRLQNRKEINKAWTNGLRIALKPNVIWNTEYSDTKVFSRIISLSEGLQDLTVNTRNGKSRIKYVERFSDDFSCNARAVSVLSRDETNVLIERNLKGEVGGGVVYRYGDLAKFKGRGAYGSSSQRSESRFQTFTGLGEHGDSLASQLVITLPQDAEIKVDYIRNRRSRRRISSEKRRRAIPTTCQSGPSPIPWGASN